MVEQEAPIALQESSCLGPDDQEEGETPHLLGVTAHVTTDGGHVGVEHRGDSGGAQLLHPRHAGLPRQEVDKPEGGFLPTKEDALPESEGGGPHGSEVCQGVEECHVGPAHGRVRDTSKEGYDGDKPERDRSGGV
jgi:hypothetical protein